MSYETGQLFIDADAGLEPIATVIKPTSFLTKALGLVLWRRHPDNTAMFLNRCRAIHMMWMSFPIDVAFLDGENRILKLKRALKPWRFSTCKEAENTLELKIGSIDDFNLKAGDKLNIQW